MSSIEVAPYFHPTQIILVDDDIDFLGNLSLQLDADLAYLLFDSTQKALSYLEKHQISSSERNHFFCNYEADKSNAELASKNKNYITINRAAIQRTMYSSDRFSQVSVVLVDYAMAHMDGLEFCQHIRDPHIKKILFTGVATESVAVDAFNNGVIDQYIRKHEHGVYAKLNSTIRQFQYDYMRDLFLAAIDILPLKTPDWLAERVVANLIEELRVSHNLVEYYMMDSDDAEFLFADADGNIKHLVIRSLCELRNGAISWDRAGAPSELVHLLSTGEFIIDPGSSGMLIENEFSGWHDYISHTQTMPFGKNGQRWAIFDVRSNGISERVKPSYNEFLEWLDTIGYALM